MGARPKPQCDLDTGNDTEVQYCYRCFDGVQRWTTIHKRDREDDEWKEGVEDAENQPRPPKAVVGLST